ncbi:MAG: sugar-transfer associated ATP-grasp domain-containing protein [Oscillospiraceae bacterium]
MPRVGSGQGHVDNISSGGMYTLVGPQGELEFPAFCDQTGLYYDRHPVTGVAFRGYRLPFFREAVELCCQAAQVEPRLGYIGWDVAVTPDGPVLVEGNNLPGGGHGSQNARFHSGREGGCCSTLSALGRPIPRARRFPYRFLKKERRALRKSRFLWMNPLRRYAAGQPVPDGYFVPVQWPGL